NKTCEVIVADQDELLAIRNQNECRNNFRGLSEEDKLKRVPAGYDKDHPMAEFLKLKSFNVIHPISDEALMSETAASDFTKVFKSIKPLNDFLNAPFI